MKLIFRFNILYYFLLFIINSSQFIYSQNLNNQIILFKEETSQVLKEIYFSDNSITFKMNNATVLSLPVNDQYFNFLNSIDGLAYGVVNYYFGQKSGKSNLEIYLVDESFKISFYKKLYFNYEEPLPKILQISANEIVLFVPAMGSLKILSVNSEKEFKLLKDTNIEFLQERIGHITFWEDKLIISLSQIKRENDVISIFYLIDLKNFDMNELKTGIDIIYKIFQGDSKIYFTGIETEPNFQGGFYFIETNKNNFSGSNITKISDLIIEGQVKNNKNIFYSRDCVYSLNENNLQKTSLCFNDEIILDVLMVEDNFFVITRKELKTNFYKANSDFKIIKKETIDRFTSNPELIVYPPNTLVVKDKNKIILEKNISEE